MSENDRLTMTTDAKYCAVNMLVNKNKYETHAVLRCYPHRGRIQLG